MSLATGAAPRQGAAQAVQKAHGARSAIGEPLLGFVEKGRLAELGYKLGRWVDVIYLQKML